MSSTSVTRHRTSNPDNDYFYARCDCGWKGAMYSNRTIEGRSLAERDARNHRCVGQASGNGIGERLAYSPIRPIL